jgi:regulator of protease activity HflC (stomatin/prohibitin superfamily)
MLALIVLSLLPFTNAIYTAIPSGHVGVKRWLGQIQPQLLTGLNFYNPLTETINLVKTIQDTDRLEQVRCVSREGVDVRFAEIGIANSIDPKYVISTVSRFGFDYDKVLVLNPLGQRMRELCAERTVDEIEITDFKELDNLLMAEIQKQVDEVESGITIHWVRLPNVIIPDTIKEKRLGLASEKANRLLAEEHAKRVAVEKQTEALVQKADNERALAHTKLEAEQIRMLSVAQAAADELAAAALAKYFAIDGYAAVEQTKALASNGNMMMYFGDHLPSNMFLGAPPGHMIPGTVPVAKTPHG